MTTQQLLDERYGRRTSRRATRAWWITVAIVAVAATTALGWSTVATSMASVDADATGYEVVDERTVTVTYQVVAPTDATVACALEAQDVEHGVVGWRVVEHAVQAGQAQAFTDTIPTVAGATTGLLNSCWFA
ncbi:MULTISPECIES: DUF4307 domain-containing protein [unclassified Microbacterium]|uniref:DUF4307 domain-containing protein n=1 Tax=unclassified Microbacterium TaxID=2609290 RepID=UPI00214B34C4|nr:MULTISPECIES: DUF4307 domain-containing protein [unclassified Microbacterium]MCR2784358.1 DUF4307 domain-containing protein [Microbacterium sp. zg.B96]WIM14819.1 DUF4307 domain-containing protein [Microbacterium sp. zg-B96]